MKFIVLKGCILEGEKRVVDQVIDLSNAKDIALGLAHKQIAEYTEVKEPTVAPTVEVENRDEVKVTKRGYRKRTRSSKSAE